MLVFARHGFPAEALAIDVLLALFRSDETLVDARHPKVSRWPGRLPHRARGSESGEPYAGMRYAGVAEPPWAK